MSGFPGKREDAKRAGMIAVTGIGNRLCVFTAAYGSAMVGRAAGLRKVLGGGEVGELANRRVMDAHTRGFPRLENSQLMLAKGVTGSVSLTVAKAIVVAIEGLSVALFCWSFVELRA